MQRRRDQIITGRGSKKQTNAKLLLIPLGIFFTGLVGSTLPIGLGEMSGYVDYTVVRIFSIVMYLGIASLITCIYTAKVENKVGGVIFGLLLSIGVISFIIYCTAFDGKTWVMSSEVQNVFLWLALPLIFGGSGGYYIIIILILRR